MIREIAQVVKSFGTEGNVIISLSPEYLSYFESKEPVFLIFEELPVPFLITYFRMKGKNRAEVAFDEISTIEAADALVGKKIYGESDRLSDQEVDDGSPDVVGLTIRNQDGTLLGKIVDLQDYSGNICLEILPIRGGDTFLIPFHEELFIDLDESEGVLTMKVPEGLM